MKPVIPLSKLPTLDAVRKERYRRSCYEFVRDFWCVVEPAVTFKDAAHLKALCDHFQAVYEGRISKLNVEIGPGYAKSMVMSVLGPAWVWGPAGNPGYRFITSTQEHGLTIRDSLRFRTLVYSPEYRALWGDSVVPMADNNKKEYIENTAKGFRVSKSVNGKATGHRAHMVITDDTLDATEAHSEASRAQVHGHLRALSSRRVDPATFKWINIGQRLHEDDAGGWCRSQGFETLCLPSEYDPSRHCRTSIGFSDWRTERGQLLFPELYGAGQLAEAKSQLGPYGYSAQHQQQPVPTEGGTLKRKWWVDFLWPDNRQWLEIAHSWDTAFGDNIKHDTSACTVWGVANDGIYLLDVWSGRLLTPQLIEQIKAMAFKWRPNRIIIEDAASGKSIIPTLDQDRSFPFFVEPFAVKGLSKDERAHLAAPHVARGVVHVPASAPWSADFFAQADVFPAGKVRDLADSAIQGINRLCSLYTFENSAPQQPAPPPAPVHPDDIANVDDVWADVTNETW